MARRLDVYLYDRLVGVLEQDETGSLEFRYTEAWLANPARTALSQSLPLRPEGFSNREARPFFAGLLPEEEKRDLVAKALGVSARNDFALLDRIGGECAGAISFRRPDEPAPRDPMVTDYRALDDQAIAQIVDTLSVRPLLAGEEGMRLSLAGAQDKLPVLVVDERLALPLNGAPSSHILKPPIRRFEDTVHNEGFCLALAKAVGLNVVNAEIREASGHTYLLVERYDRRRESTGILRRLHQEDFCQALGIAPEFKYQAEGGPSLTQCFDLVRRSTARPVLELGRLLDGVLFNLLVGNNDAHGKNYSLISGDKGIELAPLYDLSSTAVYPDLSPRFAMKIGDKDELADLYPRHWERFAKGAGLGTPQVRRRVLQLSKHLPAEARELQGRFGKNALDRPIIGRIVELIERRAADIERRFTE